VNHQMAAINGGPVADPVEAAECEPGRYQAGGETPLSSAREHPSGSVVSKLADTRSDDDQAVPKVTFKRCPVRRR
jgi:hypothetical protein